MLFTIVMAWVCLLPGHLLYGTFEKGDFINWSMLLSFIGGIVYTHSLEYYTKKWDKEDGNKRI